MGVGQVLPRRAGGGEGLALLHLHLQPHQERLRVLVHAAHRAAIHLRPEQHTRPLIATCQTSGAEVCTYLPKTRSEVPGSMNPEWNWIWNILAPEMLCKQGHSQHITMQPYPAHRAPPPSLTVPSALTLLTWCTHTTTFPFTATPSSTSTHLSAGVNCLICVRLPLDMEVWTLPPLTNTST